MKLNILLRSCALAVAMTASVATHAGYIGQSVQATAFYPDLVAPTFIGGPVTSVVGAGIEFSNGQFGDFNGPSFDFADTTITITSAFVIHGVATFNGYRFFDVNGTIDAISNVSILSDTTGLFTGDPSRITFDADNLFINFQGLTFLEEENPTFVLSVSFNSNPVPEPVSLALLGIGFTGLGLSRRKQIA